jgi:hypothetical protein
VVAPPGDRYRTHHARHPQQNGCHASDPEDRSHQTRPANVLQPQARFDAFIERYNAERHQALGMKVPADVYFRSPRVYRGLDDLIYRAHSMFLYRTLPAHPVETPGQFGAYRRRSGGMRDGPDGSNKPLHAGHRMSIAWSGGKNSSSAAALFSTVAPRNATDTIRPPLGVSNTSSRDSHFGQRTFDGSGAGAAAI